MRRKSFILGAIVISVAGILNSLCAREVLAENGNSQDTDKSSIEIRVRGDDNRTTASLSPMSPAYGAVRAKIGLNYEVEIHNSAAYYVYLSSTSSSLIGATTGNNSTIVSLNTAVEYDEIPAGNWGYRYSELVGEGESTAISDSEKFKPITVLPKGVVANLSNSDFIGNTEEGFAGDTTRYFKVEVAAAVDSAVPANIYSGEIVVSVVATPEDMGAWGVQTLQEMTAKICQIMPIGTTGPLIDARYVINPDGNRTRYSYLVSKLADGKCWMVQNLALPGGTTIGPEDSNVTYSYTLPTPSIEFKNAYNTPEVNNGSHIDATYDTAGTGNNAGGYYNWTAATAQTNSSSHTSDTVSTSICPKGWRLPIGGNNSELSTLYNAVIDSLSNKTATTAEKKAAFDAIWAPGYAGYFFKDKLNYSGTQGRWWTSTAINTLRADTLYEDTSGKIDPTHTDHEDGREGGFSVRCVFAG